MVNVGLLGADSPLAGEVIRILIHHPETEIISLYAPSLFGRSATSVHHGLLGEIPLNFTDKINVEDIDLLIIIEESDISKTILNNFDKFENLKFIILPEISLEDFKNLNYEIGLSEINRKALVRGATVAYVPSPAIVSTLIALAPLANFLLLNSDIKIEVTLPDDLYHKIDIDKEKNLLQNHLKSFQSSFNGNIDLKTIPNPNEERSVKTIISFNSALPLDEIEKIYDQTYDDHNFTFITGKEVLPEEVEGTQKNIISLSKPESGILQIEAIADGRMRGGAGDAVHIMNLFFGLHEKTGLTLKPSRYCSSKSSS